MNTFQLMDMLRDGYNCDGDFTRKYATSAFRYFARMGRPTYDEMRQTIYDKALEKSQEDLMGIRGGIAKPTEQAAINAERAVDAMAGSLNDILAVERTLLILSGKSNGREIIKAIEYVYFADADKHLERGDIVLKVTKASLEIPLSESQIYRLLREAREVFCLERGLRIK